MYNKDVEKTTGDEKMTSATIKIGERTTNLLISKKLKGFTTELEASGVHTDGKNTKNRWYVNNINSDELVSFVSGFFGPEEVEITEDRKDFSRITSEVALNAKHERILYITDSDGKRTPRKWN